MMASFWLVSCCGAARLYCTLLHLPITRHLHTHTHTLSLSFFRSPPLLEVIEQYVRRQGLRGPFRLCDYGSAFPTGASLFLSFHVALIITINRWIIQPRSFRQKKREKEEKQTHQRQDRNNKIKENKKQRLKKDQNNNNKQQTTV